MIVTKPIEIDIRDVLIEDFNTSDNSTFSRLKIIGLQTAGPGAVGAGAGDGAVQHQPRLQPRGQEDRRARQVSIVIILHCLQLTCLISWHGILKQNSYLIIFRIAVGTLVL